MSRIRLSEEELSKVRSEAGKLGALVTKDRGNFRGGRPKGSKNKKKVSGQKAVYVSIRYADYLTYLKCAEAAMVSMREFLHMNANGLRNRNPTLFVDDPASVHV